MARWLRRLLTWVAQILVGLLLVVASSFIADMLGWESRGAQRSVFGGIVLILVAALVIGSELPALKRRLREGKPPPPKHKWKWPP